MIGNHRTPGLVVAAVIACMSLAVGCESANKGRPGSAAETGMQPDMAKKVAVANIKPSAAAATQPANTNVTGTVTFTQTAADTVVVAVELSGLAPNSTHGFHIHEKGDLSSADFSSAGAHFNPAGHKHGGPGSPMAHAGDLGNVTSDADGRVKTEITIHGVTLDTAATGIIGRSVIVHAKEDDLKTDPAGNSGGRIAGGVIEPGT